MATLIKIWCPSIDGTFLRILISTDVLLANPRQRNLSVASHRQQPKWAAAWRLNDGDREEFDDAYYRLEAAYKTLADRHEESRLLLLLDSDNPYVQLYSAKMMLLSDELQAVRVLKDLGDRELPINIGVNARFIPDQWRTGILFPQHIDVEDFEKAVDEALKKARRTGP